jgi:hypothetical protein
MRQLKLLCALLAVVLSTASATRNANNFTNWYSYVGGDPRNPYSYVLTDEDPMCVGPSQLCSIQIMAGPDGQPDPTILQNVYFESHGFTRSGRFRDAIVELMSY